MSNPLFNNLNKVVAICLVCLGCSPGSYNPIDLEQSANGGLVFLKQVSNPGTGVVGHSLARKKKMQQNDNVEQGQIVAAGDEPVGAQPRGRTSIVKTVKSHAMNVVMEYVGREDALAMQLVSKRFYNELVPLRIQEINLLKIQLRTMLRSPPPEACLPANSLLRQRFELVRLPTLEVLERHWRGDAAGGPMIDPFGMTHWEWSRPGRGGGRGVFIEGVMVPREVAIPNMVAGRGMEHAIAPLPGVKWLTRCDEEEGRQVITLSSNDQQGRLHGLDIALFDEFFTVVLWRNGQYLANVSFDYNFTQTHKHDPQDILEELGEGLTWRRNPVEEGNIL